jgi:hypothetical protein
MVDVQRRDLVTELPEHVPETRRVSPAGDEARDGTAGRDQLVLADIGLHELTEVLRIHA